MTVQTPEIPRAFTTGLINAMITSPTTGVSSEAWSFVNYYIDAQAWIPKNMVIVNIDAFNRLSKANQKQLLYAAKQAERRSWEMPRQEADEKTATLREKGMTVSKPTEQFKLELQRIGKVMSDE